MRVRSRSDRVAKMWSGTVRNRSHCWEKTFQTVTVWSRWNFVFMPSPTTKPPNRSTTQAPFTPF